MKSRFFTHRVLLERAALCVTGALIITCAQAQQHLPVHGRVTDSDGQPLAGTTVMITSTKQGTTTDANGIYHLDARRGDSLAIHSIGYQSRTVVVGSSTVINVQLAAENRGLSEVVILGYGTQQKKDVTASVSTINVSELKDVPAANVTRMLAGQAAGVQVKQTTGKPGQEMQVRIRGLSSLGAGSDPLYVVDGFPVGTDIGQNLNPADISTITILKDAVSTAIYGARGSNGVVLITTKQAQQGKTTLQITANYGVQNVPESRRTKVLNGKDFAQFKKDAFMDKIRYFENREPSLDEVPADYRNPEDTKYSTNWLDAILNQNAPYQNYNVTLSAGKGNVRSLVSLGYLDQEGSLIHNGYRLYSVRANTEGDVNSFIRVGLNIVGSYSKQNPISTEGRSALVGSALLADPRDPIYNPDGSYNAYIGGHDGVFGFPNPVMYLQEITNNRYIGNGVSNGYIEFSFLKHMKFKSDYNVSLNYQNDKVFVPSTIAGVNAPPPRPASESDDAFTTLNLAADQLLTYNNNFGAHHLDALAGFTAQKETTKRLYGTGNTYPDDLTPFLGSATLKSSNSDQYGWTMAAFFGRVNYSYKDRYLFSGTFRREASSRFGINHKWGNFPALSAGWRISEESFMKDVAWLSNLKLRGSWGITGNSDIPNYESLSFMNTSNYILGGSLASGKVVGSFANSKLAWEKSSQLDIGLDAGAFQDKVSFTAEYYRRITTDMLLGIPLPAISGFTSSFSNIGKVENDGLEFQLGYRDQFGAVHVHGSFNISFNHNKVLAINGPNDEIWNGTLYADYNMSKVGRPIGMIYGFKVLGIFQNQEEIDNSPTQDGAIPGVYKYWDANGDGTVEYDQTDMVEIGNPWPKYTFGANLGADYKNFDLTVLIDGAEHYNLFRQIESSTMNMDGVFNVLEESKQRWRSEQNPGNGKYATTNTWKWERESNSRYVYDGSHVWIRNISIGYTLEKATLGFASLRLYLSSDNLILITKYPGNNPDIDLDGGINPGRDDEGYPVPRTFSIGANLTF